MKYRLNEQQLNNLIAESTMRILSEAMEDEGIGKFLGDMAGRIRNGINKFSSDFNAARNNRLYQNRNYDSYQNYGYDPNSRNFDPNTARQYKDTKNAGASRTAMGNFQTQYGDTVPGAQPKGNPQVEPQNTQQTTPPSTPQNGPQDNPQMQQNQNIDYEKVQQLANQADAALRACKAKGLTMEKDGNNRIFKTEDGGPRNQEQNQLVQAYKQAYNAWMNARGAKNRLNISESKLNNIIKESVKKVLNEAKKNPKRQGTIEWGDDRVNATEDGVDKYGNPMYRVKNAPSNAGRKCKDGSRRVQAFDFRPNKD